MGRKVEGLFRASSSCVQVNGETVQAMFTGVSTFPDRIRASCPSGMSVPWDMAYQVFQRRAERLLASHGIRGIRPGHWYPQQAWLDAFRDLTDHLGLDALLFHIGTCIPDHALFPTGPRTVEEGLAALQRAYQMNHRGGEIGSYTFEPLSRRSGLVVCQNPYPSEFDRGIITALARRLLPSEALLRVVLDPHRPSRRRGGDSCTFRVDWDSGTAMKGGPPAR